MFVNIVTILFIMFIVAFAVSFIIRPVIILCYLFIVSLVCGVLYAFALCYHACKRQTNAGVNAND